MVGGTGIYNNKVKFNKLMTNSFIDKLILNIINSLCNKRGRIPSYNNEHYLETIKYILKNGCCWNDYKGKLNGSTYKKKFYYWNKYHIFELAYEQH